MSEKCGTPSIRDLLCQLARAVLYGRVVQVERREDLDLAEWLVENEDALPDEAIRVTGCSRPPWEADE